MPNNYKGLNISGLKSTTKLSRVQVAPTVDFVEITDRGSISETPSKLRTAGAGHSKRSGSSPKSTIGTAFDMSSSRTLLSQANHSQQYSEPTLTVSPNGRYVYSMPNQSSNGDKLDMTDFGEP